MPAPPSAHPDHDGRGDLALPTLSNAEAPSTEAEAHSEQKRGVVAASRIRAVITQRDIHIAYAALTLVALGTTFAQTVQGTYVAYATSAFRTHAQLATARVVQGVFAMTAFAIVPKLTDNISRISPWIFACMIGITMLSDAMMAGAKNVETYIGASVFAGLGATSYELSTQVYIAETTSIVSRAFWNVALDAVASIAALYSGPEIGGRVLETLGTAEGWRWGYGMWCLIVPALAIPFIAILHSWTRRVNQVSDELIPLPPHRGLFDQVFHDYDLVGSVLFVGAIALILVPLSIAGGRAAAWTGDKIGMMVVGFISLALFVVWSLPTRVRPSFLFEPRFPLIPWHILKNPSVMAMFIVNLFDFMSYGMFSIYFQASLNSLPCLTPQSFLQVASRFSPAQAAQIDNTVRIVFQVTAVAIGLLMRFWTPLCIKLGLGPRLFHTKYPILIGVPLCVLSLGLEIDFVQHPNRASAVAQFVVARGLFGLGRGLFQTTSQVSIQAAAKRGELSIATGIFYLAMSLGGSIGQAGAAAIWGKFLPDALARNLPTETRGEAANIFGSIVVAMRYAPDSATGIAVNASYIEAMKTISIAAVCLQIPMLVAMFFVKSIRLTEDEQVTLAGKRIALDKRRESERGPGSRAGSEGEGEGDVGSDSKYGEPATAVQSREKA